jgi:hypothetical protein
MCPASTSPAARRAPIIAARGIFVDTALGAAYDCGSITRLICVNGSAVNGVLSRTVHRSQRARHRPRAGQRSE